MLNIGLSEMLIIAAIALIVVGPKDLPAMLRQMGKVFGSVRRMGNEFKSEISKVAALDEIKDIKSSITKPLQDTHEELTNQFNTVGKDGVEPSGAIKPAVEGQESVANEIRESAGLPTTPSPDPAAAASSMKAAIARAQTDAAAKVDGDVESEAAPKTPAKKAAPRKRAAKKTSTSTKTVAAKKAPAKKAAPKKPAVRKTTTAKTTAAKSATARKAAPKKAAAAKEVKPITAVANKGGIPAKTAAKLQRAAPAKAAATPKGDA